MSFALTAAAHTAYLDTLNGQVPPKAGRIRSVSE
jgi:hypothetical protein